LLHLLAQELPSAVKAYVQVADGDPEGLRHGPRLAALEVDSPEDFGVGGSKLAE